MAETGEKFTFTVYPNSYTYYPNKHVTFNNSYGEWTLNIKREGGLFTGKITLAPSKPISWEKMKIHLKLQNISNSSYNVFTDACYDEGLEAFTFAVLYIHTYHNTFLITIEIDASSAKMSSLPMASKSMDHLMELFESGKLADVIIKTHDGNQIKAHNCILSRSEVFYAMLNKHDTKEAQQKVIKITDIDHYVLVEMVRYLYCDEAPKIEEMALYLLVAADKYDVQGLYNECVFYLGKNVNMENYSQILVTADQLEIECLKQEAIDYIIKNRKKIYPTEIWKKLKKEKVQLAMEILEKSSLL